MTAGPQLPARPAAHGAGLAGARRSPARRRGRRGHPGRLRRDRLLGWPRMTTRQYIARAPRPGPRTEGGEYSNGSCGAHGGDGLGSHTEFWHLPRERLTLAVSWNDDLLDRERAA